MSKQFDAIIIGTGQAGPPLAVRLANNGMQVAIIERQKFGGTCVNYGCIPTKALVANAHVIHTCRTAGDFGVVYNGRIDVDMNKVKSRKDQIVHDATTGVEQWLKNTDNCHVIEGHAKFKSNHSIEVNGKMLTANKIFINVGARASTPSIPGIDKIDYLTNSSILTLNTLPEHLIIIGGSYIGLEFAQIYRRFGAKVTVIEKADRLIPREDEDVSKCVYEILTAEGIDIELNNECIAFEKQDEDIVVKLTCPDRNHKQIVGSHLLMAVGRVPNTDDLGLDHTDISVNDKGFINVNDTLATDVEGVWALGECNGHGPFTHTAYNDYEIVADNLLSGQSRTLNDRILTYGLFIDPPLGRAGMTEAQVKQSGRQAYVATRLMKNVKRAKIKGETQGFMKAIIDAKTNEILGAVVLGVGGDEIIHLFLDVMYAKAPYTTIKNAVHIHPTVSELIPTMLSDLEQLT